MGYTIHVAKVYEVKYGSNAYFKWKTDRINRFLYENCPSLQWDGDDVFTSERLEVPRKELSELIDKIVDNREYYETVRETWGFEESLEELIVIFSQWITDSDQRNDFVVLQWF
jgi:hypothetical protein